MANGNKMLRREDTIAFNDHESRQFIARHCFRNNGEARYVLKSVRRDVLFNSMGDDTTSMLGLCDLAVETMFLSSIVHPNIIKLRAISTADPCSGQYFLVLDRLQETLQQRMETKWVKRERQLYSAVGRYVRDRSGRKRLDFFEHRLERAFDLSSAIEHLHSHKIVHRGKITDTASFALPAQRLEMPLISCLLMHSFPSLSALSHSCVDIKPDNIGFDVRGTFLINFCMYSTSCFDPRSHPYLIALLFLRLLLPSNCPDDIKLFDFGMARELRDDYKTKDGNYRLSKCGSPRYMAPEVFWGQPYNSMADVYSFAVVLYEMIALNRAFNFVCDEEKNTKKRAKTADEDPAKIEEKFIRLVFKEHKRPDLSRLRAPPSIKELLPMCWSSNPEYRCDMALTNSTLRKELIMLSKGDESRLPDFTKRRSTYIFGDSGPFKKSNRSGSSSRSLSKSVDSILRSKGSKHGMDMFDVSFGSLDASMYSFRTTENEK
jgi:serine/threonine protein kinase